MKKKHSHYAAKPKKTKTLDKTIALVIIGLSLIGFATKFIRNQFVQKAEIYPISAIEARDAAQAVRDQAKIDYYNKTHPSDTTTPNRDKITTVTKEIVDDLIEKSEKTQTSVIKVAKDKDADTVHNAIYTPEVVEKANKEAEAVRQAIAKQKTNEANPAGGGAGPQNPGQNAGSGSCGTNGSPVLSGTAVATGQYETDDKGKQILDIDHAYCRKCNGRSYGGDELCKNLVNSGYPVALPTHLESSFRDAQGNVVKIHKCFATVDGLNVQVGGGETVETKTGKKQCNPGDGHLVDPNSPSGKALLTDGMKSFCSFRGMDSSEGKCVAKTPPKVEDVKSDADYLREREEKRKQAIEDRKKKCSTTAECDQKTCEAVVVENGGDSQYRCTLIQGTKNYGLIPANHNITISATNSTLPPKTQSTTLNQPATEKPYTTKTKCEATISNTNIQNCVPVQGGGYVRVAADSGRTYISYSFGTYKPTTSTASTPDTPANPSENTPEQVATGNSSNTSSGKIGKPCSFSNQCGEGNTCDHSGYWFWTWKCANESTTSVSPTNDKPSLYPLQKEDGLVGVSVKDPDDCKYKPGNKSAWTDNYECPTEWQGVTSRQENSLTNTSNENNNVTNKTGIVDGHARDRAECKYGNLAVEDPAYGDWICPSEKEASANTPPTTKELPSNTPLVSTQRAKNIGIVSAPAGILAGLACAASGVGLPIVPLCVIGGMVGGGAVGALFPTTTDQSNGNSEITLTQYDKADLKDVVRDASLKTLSTNTLTDDPAKCKNGGGEVSGQYGGYVSIGYHVYKCQ